MAEDLQKQLEKILNKQSKVLFAKTQEALLESAQETAALLRRSSPVGNSADKFIDHWVVAKYKNAMYIGNTKLSSSRIPLTNILNAQSGLLDNFWAKNEKSIQAKTITRLKSKLQKRSNR